MSTDQVNTVLAAASCCNWSIQEVAIFSAVFLAILVVLKNHFRGGQFNIPKVDLSGKYAVVTGGNSGIGAETVRELSKLGCEVVIGARSKETAEEVIKSIRKENPNAKVQYIPLDLASRTSIESFAKNVQFPQIDYLVNNAGLMALPQRRTTKEGFEMQWGVNHLGHFYLTSLLWSKVAASKFFRIINVSSLAHKKLLGFGPEPKPDWENINFQKDYDANVSYSRSKLYNVLFTKALSQKIGKRGIAAALHPGVVRTELMREMKADGIKGKILKFGLILVYPLWWLFSKSAKEGSQTTLYTLLAEDVQSGQYYADCKKSPINSNATLENSTTLWQISEKSLQVKFDNL